MMEYLRDRITLAPFVAIWLVYFLLLWLAGFESIYDSFGKAVLFQILFVAAVCLPVLIFRAPEKISFNRPSRHDRKIFLFSVAIGVLALCFLLLDRFYVQNIDYSGGACMARWQMSRMGLEREGVSSSFSVIGQLLGYTYFVAATTVMTRAVSRRTFWIIMGMAFLLLMVQAQVAASRTPLILFATFVFAAASMRVADGGMPRVKFVDLVMTVLLGLVAVGFILSIFSCRAAASHQTTAEYAQDFTEFLGAKEGATAGPTQSPVSEVRVPTEGWRSTYLGGLFSITALYTVHSAYTFAGIISLPADDQILTMDGPLYLLKRAGIHIDNGTPNQVLAGRFPSLPGTLYHDFGWAGVLFGGLILGVALWLATHMVARTHANVLAVGVACAIFTIAYTSPLLLATNIAVFPFVCFGYLVVPVVAYFALFLNRGKYSDE